jgi:HAE1 family hydrophobic/amphiphilic exporter-1
MGIAVVGGMLTSTFLTLFVIPVVYTALSDAAERVSRKSIAAPAGLQEVPGK